MKHTLSVIVLLIVLTASVAFAADITPSFANPTPAGGWTTDRYEPTSFSNVGTFQGRDDVLGIQITSATNLANRPSGYKSTFYNTQGRGHSAVGGAGSFIAADLWIPQSWSNAANGNVRTDMWGGMSPCPSDCTEWAIIGFTNYGGAARLRLWDDDQGGWVDLATAIKYDSWNRFSISYTGTSIDYAVNDTSVYSDATLSGATGFNKIVMQAYNFADPSISGAVLADYTAHWANTPEPGFYGLLSAGLGGLLYLRRRRAV